MVGYFIQRNPIVLAVSVGFGISSTAGQFGFHSFNFPSKQTFRLLSGMHSMALCPFLRSIG